MKAILTPALVLLCSTMLFSAPTINHNTFSAQPATTQTAALQPVLMDNGPEESKVSPIEKKSDKPEGSTKEVKPADTKKSESNNINSDFKLLQRGKKVMEFKYHLYA